MKITNMKLRQVSGTMPTEGEFWEERLIRPIDIYPEHKAERAGAGIRDDQGGGYPHSAVFIELETDAGHVGIGGPITLDLAFIVDRQFRHLVEGANPVAGELIWDKLYRHAIHGRKGDTMLAISAMPEARKAARGPEPSATAPHSQLPTARPPKVAVW